MPAVATLVEQRWREEACESRGGVVVGKEKVMNGVVELKWQRRLVVRSGRIYSTPIEAGESS
jgi:hypothetical protein